MGAVAGWIRRHIAGKEPDRVTSAKGQVFGPNEGN